MKNLKNNILMMISIALQVSCTYLAILGILYFIYRTIIQLTFGFYIKNDYAFVILELISLLICISIFNRYCFKFKILSKKKKIVTLFIKDFYSKKMLAINLALKSDEIFCNKFLKTKRKDDEFLYDTTTWKRICIVKIKEIS